MFLLCYILFVYCFCIYYYVRVWCCQLPSCVQSPPASAKVPKSVSDRKRFFENAMEDQSKPAPKTGKSFLFFYYSPIKRRKSSVFRATQKIYFIGVKFYTDTWCLLLSNQWLLIPNRDLFIDHQTCLSRRTEYLELPPKFFIFHGLIDNLRFTKMCHGNGRQPRKRQRSTHFILLFWVPVLNLFSIQYNNTNASSVLLILSTT